MTKQELINKIAHLESLNDHLSTELTMVDTLMRSVGFTQGLATIKAAADEILEQRRLGIEEIDS